MDSTSQHVVYIFLYIRLDLQEIMDPRNYNDLSHDLLHYVTLRLQKP